MKKTLLAVLAATTLMSTGATAATFNIYNNSQAVLSYFFTNEKGHEVERTIQGGGFALGVETTDKLHTQLWYANFGRNTYGNKTDNNEYNINIWQTQPGYFVQTIDEVIE